MKTKILPKFKRLKLLLYAFLVISSSLLTYSFTNSDFEISKNLDIFATLYKELNLNYVDETKPGSLMKTAIDAMLESLDPYTVFIPESQIEDYKFMTTGVYGGIGALIHQQDDHVVISEPYEGFPAEKEGVLAGDIILKVDGKDMSGKSSSALSDMLKGQSGTEIELTLQRYGEKKPIIKTLIRENIKIDNVPYYGMVNENTAYIILTDFTTNAAKEVKDAFLELKKENNVEQVIIDLRGNGGGLLDEAVKLANIFVPKNELIVSTKGKLKQRNSVHKTTGNHIDEEIPLAVLVDRGSASASEIFAGAMQDLDRGVVVGKKTFGKGLVQNIIPLSYNSRMKVTVAKYYIPSGRCIQAIDYANRNEDGSIGKVPDSLITEFQTRNGRLVHDGGGILPDINTDDEKFNIITQSLATKFIIFEYCTKFRHEHPTIATADKFEITDEIYNDFVAFVEEKDFDYTTATEKKLEELKKIAERELYFDAIETDFESLKQKLIHDKNADLQTYKDEIKSILRESIVMRYYHQKGMIKSSLKDDPDVMKAIEIMNNKAEYKNILTNVAPKEKKG